MKSIFLLTLITSLCFSCAQEPSHEDSLKNKSVFKDSVIQIKEDKSSIIFRDTVISNNIAHIIEFDKLKQILKISANASIYLLDSISVDKILDIEVSYRNKKKDTDLLIY